MTSTDNPEIATQHPDVEPAIEAVLQRIQDRARRLEDRMEERIKERAELIYLQRLRLGRDGDRQTDWLEAEREICQELERWAQAQGNNHRDLAHA